MAGKYHLYADDIQLYCSHESTEHSKLYVLMTRTTSINMLLHNYLQLNSGDIKTLINADQHYQSSIKKDIGSLSGSVKSRFRKPGLNLGLAMSVESFETINEELLFPNQKHL